MDITQFYLAIIIGTVLSLLLEEIAGISCGGIIVPGYLAMVCDDIPTLLIILFISFVCYLVVNFGLSKVMILYGKRKFAVTLVIALVLNIILKIAFPFINVVPFEAITFRGVGAITPALLANTYARQGIRYTLPACAVVTAVTFGIVTLICTLIR